jgi:hypothetical protein
MIFFLFFVIVNAFNVKYLNETEWKFLRTKLDLRTYDERNVKLCYFFNLKCSEI